MSYTVTIKATFKTKKAAKACLEDLDERATFHDYLECDSEITGSEKEVEEEVLSFEEHETVFGVLR